MTTVQHFCLELRGRCLESIALQIEMISRDLFDAE